MARSKTVNCTFQWNGNTAKIQQNLGLGKGLNKDFAEIMLRRSEKYTPYSAINYGGNYHMMNMRYIKAERNSATITYTKPYAKYQYNIPMKHYTGVHELATDHWVEFCYSQESVRILVELETARRARSRKQRK